MRVKQYDGGVVQAVLSLQGQALRRTNCSAHDAIDA